VKVHRQDGREFFGTTIWESFNTDGYVLDTQLNAASTDSPGMIPLPGNRVEVVIEDQFRTYLMCQYIARPGYIPVPLCMVEWSDAMHGAKIGGAWLLSEPAANPPAAVLRTVVDSPTWTHNVTSLQPTSGQH